MTHDERENQKAAERLIPGAIALTKQAMTPAQQQAARIEKDVEASALGRELMMPMPKGWFRTQHELTDGPWEVCAQHHEEYKKAAWPVAHDRFAAVGFAPTLTEAHRLCREQAWAKHKKNTEGTNA